MSEPSHGEVDQATQGNEWVIPDEVMWDLVEQSPDAIVLIDSQGRLVLVNGQVEHLFGYSRDRLLGQPVEMLLPEGNREVHQDRRADFASRPRTRPMGIGMDLEARRCDGSTFPVAVSLTPLSTIIGDFVIGTVRDVTEQKAVADAQAELSRLRAIADLASLHRELTATASSGQGLLGIAQAVKRVTQRAVAIEDPEGSVLAWTDPIEPEPAFPRGAARRRRLLEVNHAEAFRHDDRLIAVARPDQNVLGIISLLDPDATAGELEAIALEQAATVLTMEFFRLRSVAEAELAVWGDLTSELLEGDNVSQDRSHARALGYDIDHPHRAVVIERTEEDVGSLEPAVRRAIRRFESEANLITSRTAGVVLLIDHDLPWVAFADAIDEENNGPHRIGVGSFRNLDGFHRSLTEAETALELADRLGRGDRVTLFDDLGVWRLLAADGDPSDLADFVRHWIGTLIDYDASHGTDLVKTLTTYLENDRSHESTARRLLIHRSTLRYRLGRIDQLSGLDLSDPDARFNAGLACRAWITLSASKNPLRGLARRTG